jgi:hypothetical protein
MKEQGPKTKILNRLNKVRQEDKRVVDAQDTRERNAYKI